MKKIKQVIATLAVVFGLVLVPATAVGAVDVFEPCQNNQDTAVCNSADDQVQPLIQTIVNILLFVIGIIAVVMIIIGGIMYATSAGDAAQVTRAKNTILYAIVGLVIAFLAFAIVNFVVTSL